MQVTSQAQSIIMSANLNEPMEVKPARLTILIDAEKKKAFEALCAAQDITASQALRQMIREYLARHGTAYETSLPERRASGG